MRLTDMYCITASVDDLSLSCVKTWDKNGKSIPMWFSNSEDHMALLPTIASAMIYFNCVSENNLKGNPVFKRKAVTINLWKARRYKDIKFIKSTSLRAGVKISKKRRLITSKNIFMN